MCSGNKDTLLNIVCGESQEPKKEAPRNVLSYKTSRMDSQLHGFNIWYVIYFSYTCI